MDWSQGWGVKRFKKEGPPIVLAGHPTVPARAPSGPASIPFQMSQRLM